LRGLSMEDARRKVFEAVRFALLSSNRAA
jgi:hypothetical protein